MDLNHPACTFLVALIFCSSCSNKIDATQYVIEETDSVEQTYANRKFVTKYYPDGNIRSEFTYVDGSLDGDIYDYYNIQDTVIWTNYPEIGEARLMKVSRLKNYYFLHNSVVIFEANFSAEKQIEELKGNPILYHLIPEKDYQLGDTLVSEVIFADLKEVDISASLIEFSGEGFIFLDSLDINSESKAHLTYIFRKQGMISLGIQYAIQHEDFYKKDEVVIPTFHLE